MATERACCVLVEEKEKLRGRDPLAPDDVPFGEYTARFALLLVLLFLL